MSRFGAILAVLAAALLSRSAAYAAQVPFVGCKSDGQIGPQAAPGRPARTPDLPAGQAARLAWYATDYDGVLAPRGWHCFGLYGSSGSFLMVTPEDHSQKPFDAKLEGPAVQIGESVGDTSGRFEAARIAARLFPNRRDFVNRVKAEGFMPSTDFVSGPFPGDRIQRLGADAVAFETPAHTDGMGTSSRLVKSADPIEGLAKMDENNDATLLAVRLPAALRDLAPAIVKAARTNPRP